MEFRNYYLGCLAHGSYMIIDGGEAAVIDPQRDVDFYLEEVSGSGAILKYVVETHLHADFVSGHVELAKRTGAEILIGAKAGAEFAHTAVRDGDEFHLGETTLIAMETPGHTPESISWLVRSPSEPDRLLTGDTLFIGDVGRPDLAGSRGFTAEEMAGMMFDSLHSKILPLDDSTEIWPAHGAGSACGRNISSERSSTLGAQKRSNWALQIEDRDEFVRKMTENLPAAPAYFSMDAELNRKGARPLSEITAPRLEPEKFSARMEGALVLDVRGPEQFGEGHIPGSVNIGLGGQFAPWSGELLDPASEILIVADDERKADEAVMRLARVGFENVSGVLAGGFAAWKAAGQETSTLSQRTVHDLSEDLDSGLTVLDVRRPAEFSSGRVPGAVGIPLSELRSRLAELEGMDDVAVICAGGYRSSIAASILLEAGVVSKIANVRGGFAQWRDAGLEIEREQGAA